MFANLNIIMEIGLRCLKKKIILNGIDLLFFLNNDINKKKSKTVLFYK